MFAVFIISASLRLGGEKCSYDKHCLVVGDAAGMIDPLTGNTQSFHQTQVLISM